MKAVIVTVLAIVLLAIVGIGAYVTGQSNGLAEAQTIRTQFAQSRSSSANAQGNSGQSSTNARSQAGRPAASGTIKTIQGEVIELSQQDGSTVTVALSAQTTIQKVVTGASTDLQVGQRVSVQGTQATGQVNAQVIQISQSVQ